MEELVSLRPSDNKASQAVDEFLMRFFFRKQFNKVEKVEDKPRQTKGMDFIADGLIIDCKAQTSYVNRPTQTFTQEIWTYDTDAHIYRHGWFVREGMATTHYMFIWVPEATVNKLTNSNQIQKLEVMICDAKALQNYIFTFASRERLINYGWTMIQNPKIDRVVLSNFSKFPVMREWYKPEMIRSGNLAEGPVNLKLHKTTLKPFAIKHCYVTVKEIVDIP